MLSNINEYLERDVHDLLGNIGYSFVHNPDTMVLKLESSDKLLEVLTLLRDHKLYKFKILIDLFGVDYPGKTKRFEVNYSLLSVHNNHRINIKVDVEDHEPLPSVVGLFSSAGWLEREVWDMYGITFSGNNDLRRILTDYGFEGHPLRKDFPLTGYKEVRYDPKKKKVVYEDVVLAQEFRTFDFESPWHGDGKP